MFTPFPLYPLIQLTPGRQDIKWLLLEKENACKNPLKRSNQDIIQFLMLPISFNDLLLCKKTGEAIKNPVSL